MVWRSAPASRARCATVPAPATPRMAPASLGMNTAALRARGGGGVGSGPLPFSVESLLEAERGPDSEPTDPGKERPLGATELRVWFPPAALACPPRKCPDSRSRVLSSAPAAWGENQSGEGAVAHNLQSNGHKRAQPERKERKSPPGALQRAQAQQPLAHPSQAGFVPAHDPKASPPGLSC